MEPSEAAVDVQKMTEPKKLILDVDALKRKIGFKPNRWQEGALEHMKRFTKIVGGKRCGKSMLTSYVAFRELQTSEKLIWVVAPTYELASRVWDNVEPWAQKFSYIKIRKADPIMGRSLENSITGSVLRIKSADNPKQLKGKAGDLLIAEECGDMEESVWPNYLEPFISEVRPSGNKGRAMFIGNASNKGSWFHRLWSMPPDEENFSMWVPTALWNTESQEIDGSTNPDIITIEELKRLKKSNSERVWRQEWMAEFLSGTGEIFRNIQNCIADSTDPSPKPKRYYYMGVDLAKHQDFTVLTVMDANTFEVVHIDRFNQIDWPLQKIRIYETARLYNNATIIMDSTGVGDPIFEDLQRMGLDVQGYKFTNSSKKALIDKLSIYIEQARIKFPNEPNLIRELELYTYKRSDSGNEIYNAPEGEHDDMVVSLALATWQLPEHKTMVPMDNNIATVAEEDYITDSY